MITSNGGGMVLFIEYWREKMVPQMHKMLTLVMIRAVDGTRREGPTPSLIQLVVLSGSLLALRFDPYN